MRTRCSRLFESIESLEARIAPAAVSFSFPEYDGDIVTIKSSVGTKADLMTAAKIVGDRLQSLDLSATTWGTEFAGASVTISVKKAPTGDGFVEMGYLNASGIDLGAVSIKGDLGQIDAGDGSTPAQAIRSLSVSSMGRFGLQSQGVGGSLVSDIAGAVGSLNVTGDLRGVFLDISGGPTASLGALTIGGSIIGGTDPNTGCLAVDGTIGLAMIKGDLRGGSGSDSGSLIADVRIKTARISGSIVGGSGFNSGRISSDGEISLLSIRGDLLGGDGLQSGNVRGSGKLGAVEIGGSIVGSSGDSSGIISTSGVLLSLKVGRDVIGKSGDSSGSIFAFAGLGSVSVGGSLYGGTKNSTGFIGSQGDVGAVKIGRDVVGGSITGTAGDVLYSGTIRSGARLASVTVGGSIRAGVDHSTGGALILNASIIAGNDIGSLTVGGSIVGSEDPNGNTVVTIGARGQATPGAFSDLAIGKVTVGDSVERTLIIAGYIFVPGLTPTNGDASIGPVKVGRDWIASDLIAGASKTTEWGLASNTALGGGNASLAATIASITIGGGVTGTPDSVSSTDHYGFVAQQIGSFKEGGIVLAPRIAATDLPIELSRLTGDVTVREV